ncbi:3-deoxy-7-phosphoheptulonate synthase [Streptomyces sporangiiformans]|uniref:Phospho-2-dehydro-3-deoxyheptonate aldolase n=1 Tax=Streptomyces sporangiiformans TaxID=2315329 RepID=A0A505D7U9_9ACTN|nr:3-deoxy-7-phosphoheptulonate synthase [Streptomyces sporangiiformans]TPQ15566.1 3-deoxy-7-phosphoheptulonate synthase [Streptomyces sporangiiformans]
MDNALLDTQDKPARQQPDWADASRVRQVRDTLSRCPALVDAWDVDTLRSLLARVASGEALILQSGDCAEDPAECTPGYVARKTAVMDLLVGALKMITHKPVVRVGRIAGQFGKPRSSPTELVGGVELPSYRGHMVNGPEPDPESRRPEPQRILACYQAAREIMTHLGWRDAVRRQWMEPPVWTSHEALILDYELPMVRRDERGRLVLTSTHWPWIGERTRQLDGAHVALLSRVANPVACKIGPKVTADELLGLCERLDPQREKGRLTLIARMGAATVGDRLPKLVAAAREAGHPVIWLTDAMHGNTVTLPNGLKTRYLETIEREIQEFQEAVRSEGGIVGGLHLETTPDDVTECVPNDTCVDHVADKYTSYCDPRLNPSQAVAVASAWLG